MLPTTPAGAAIALRCLPRLPLRRRRIAAERPAASSAPQVATVAPQAYSNGAANAPSSSENGLNSKAMAPDAEGQQVQRAAQVAPLPPSAAKLPPGPDGAVAVFGAGVGGAVPVQAMFSPPETYQAVVAVGTSKAKLPSWQTFMLAVAAGCYTAMFCSLLLMVGPNSHGLAASNPGLARYLIGAIGLPFQLLVIKVCAGRGQHAGGRACPALMQPPAAQRVAWAALIITD